MSGETDRLSDDEISVWEMLVENGARIRAPRLEAKARLREEHRMTSDLVGEFAKKDRSQWKRREKCGLKRNSLKEIPVGVKRFIIMRSSGITFAKSAELSGARWVDVIYAKDHCDEVQNAFEGMMACSRELMLMKAASTLELSQDDGADLPIAKVNAALKIMSSLDRDHFGEDRGGGDERQPAVSGGGGFVINLIQDAAKVAESAVPGRGRALVYTDV